MNANAKRWIKALRSGKYKAGRGYLRKGNRFCPLGVGCDLFVASTKSGKRMKVRTRDDEVVSYNDRVGTLPFPVRKWLGLNSSLGGYVNSAGQQTSIVNDADLRHRSFKTIANIIESEPEGLFKKERKHVKTNRRRAKATA